MERSRVLRAFIATRFYDRTTWLPSSNHLRDESQVGVQSMYLKGILIDKLHRFIACKCLV